MSREADFDREDSIRQACEGVGLDSSEEAALRKLRALVEADPDRAGQTGRLAVREGAHGVLSALVFSLALDGLPQALAMRRASMDEACSLPDGSFLAVACSMRFHDGSGCEHTIPHDILSRIHSGSGGAVDADHRWTWEDDISSLSAARSALALAALASGETGNLRWSPAPLWTEPRKSGRCWGPAFCLARIRPGSDGGAMAMAHLASCLSSIPGTMAYAVIHGARAADEICWETRAPTLGFLVSEASSSAPVATIQVSTGTFGEDGRTESRITLRDATGRCIGAMAWPGMDEDEARESSLSAILPLAPPGACVIDVSPDPSFTVCPACGGDVFPIHNDPAAIAAAKADPDDPSHLACIADASKNGLL